MTLTPKQEKFAQLYVEKGNASEAYRQAYNSKAKYETVNVSASKLLSDPKVSLRVRELRKQLEKTALWNREESFKVLAAIARGEDEDARTGDRINAVKEINRMHGWDAEMPVDDTDSVIEVRRVRR